MKKTMWITLIILIVLINIAFIALYMQNQTEPTLGLNIGHTNGQLTPLPKTPNAISSQSKNPKRHVAPLAFKSTTEQTMAALIKAVEAHGGGRIITQESNYLYAIFTSNIFRFKDDVEFYLDDTTKEVHVRSASRAGKSDLGVNLKRYESIKTLYAQ